LNEQVLFRFAGVRHPVLLSGCADLIPYMEKVLAAWPHEAAEMAERGSGGRGQKLTLDRDQGFYVLNTPWLAAPIRHRDPVHTVCDLVVHLIHAFVATNPASLCLHSAAVRLGGHLVVFPNVYRGGKSLLSGHLAAQGVACFGDDVIPVRGRGNHGFALGIAPRLRLPLPDTTAPGFADFVAAHAGPASTRYQYLHLDRGRLVPYGEVAPIGAFVVLDRGEGREAALMPLAPAEALRRVVQRNFARHQPARNILLRLERLVLNRPCYRLAYDDPATAASLLRARFASWPDHAGRRRTSARRGAAHPAPSGSVPGSETSGPWWRGPTVIERRVAGELFLINGETDSIYHLNPLADALWRLAAEAVEEADMIRLLRAAFPGVAPKRIAGDVKKLLGSLGAKGLLHRRGA
jgi:hypothetical protein